MITQPCPACGGQGLQEMERTLEVKIPAGVDTGSRLRLPQEGEHGRRGGGAGDLYVVIEVEPHPRFRREGVNVLSEVNLSYAQAVLGTEVEVETLHGPVPLEIPGGTQHGALFRLPGKGISRLGGRGRGDHLVRVHLEVPDPRRLGEEELQLLRRLAELEGRQVREEGAVFRRVRNLFHS